MEEGVVGLVRGGPAIARWAGSTDNTNTRLADVGTTTLAGQMGSGNLAGTLLSLTLDQRSGQADTVGTTGGELNGFGDNETRWIWVQPQNN